VVRPAAPGARGSGYLTRNVFIVSVDGLNNSEAFDAPDPSVFIPNLNRMRAYGALYRNVYNLGGSWSTAANYGIVDGSLEIAAQSIYYYRHFRPRFPTVFEYYRRAYPEMPQDKVWAVVGMQDCTQIDFSSHPLYGEAYASSLDERTMNLNRPDEQTWSALQARMDQHHPSLVLFQLGGVAQLSEQYGWGGYLLGIEKMDRIIGQLWDKIQADPFYQDTTTLLVTSSHGWTREEHGCLSESCKRLFLLAIGPDIRAGAEFTDMRRHTDICPTVGELLGFATPYCEGRVLHEMIDGYPGGDGASGAPRATWQKETQLTHSSGHVEQPQIAVNGQGLHVVWVDDRSGRRQVYYTTRAGEDEAWSAALSLHPSEVEARAPAMTVDGDSVHIAWLDYVDGQWAVYYRQRSAAGEWSPVELVVDSVVGGAERSQMVWEPAVAACDGQVAVAVPMLPYGLRVFHRTEGGGWSGITLVDSSRRPEPDNRVALPQGLSMASSRNRFYLLWHEVDKITWALKFARTEGCTDTWIRDALPPTFIRGAHDGSLAVDGPLVHSAWVVLEHLSWSAEPHDTMRGRSSNGGLGWEQATALFSTPTRHTRMAASADMVAMVWEDYRGGFPTIRLTHSLDDGSSWQDQRVSQGDALVAEPAVAVEGETAYVVWRDQRDGTWQLYLGEVGQGEPIPTPTCTPTRTLSPTPTFTATDTATQTPTASATQSPTLTESPSATNTPSLTATPLWVYLPMVRKGT